MFERFKSLPQLWRSGRLALRLVRDPRVPTAAKLLFGATVLYMLSPIDVVPDWLPVLGQADDLVVLLAGLNLFLRACPKWLVSEHEEAIDGRGDDRQPGVSSWSRDSMHASEYQGAGAPSSGAHRGSRATVDGEYQRVR